MSGPARELLGSAAAYVAEHGGTDLDTVSVQARYYLDDAVEAHRAIEKGHTMGKLVLIADTDLAAELGV
jgi:Zinc-binding dehydrogenase